MFFVALFFATLFFAAVVLALFRYTLVQGLEDACSQRVDALSVQRGDQQGGIEAELRAGFRQHRLPFALVGDDHNPFAAQALCQVAFGRGELGLRVQHEENERDLFDQCARFVPCKVALVRQLCPCAIDQCQVEGIEDERLFDPVLRHACAACHGREVLLQQPIEQRGLSGVGSADDQNFGGFLLRKGHSKAWMLPLLS